MVDVDVKKMSYTQFVALIDQWNVPPGALNTINQWSVFGHVTENSRVLEVACTTGLSSREISRITGCSAVGIDICADSIESAKMNAEIYGKGLDLKYVCQDACEYECEGVSQSLCKPSNVESSLQIICSKLKNLEL